VHDRDECLLKSLPKGYKLFTHHKRYRDEEGHERERKDHYLMGEPILNPETVRCIHMKLSRVKRRVSVSITRRIHPSLSLVDDGQADERRPA
jgi:hypothetical protein